MTSKIKQKILSALLALWLVCQLFFTLHQVEYFPFFLFGFYSDPVPEQFVSYEIRHNDELIHLPLLKKEFIDNQLSYYEFLMQLNGKDLEQKALIKRRFSSAMLSHFACSKLLNQTEDLQRFKRWLESTIRIHGYSGSLSIQRVTRSKHNPKMLKEYVFQF